MLYVYHVVLDEDDMDNIKRWTGKLSESIEEWVQIAVDNEIAAELELEKGEPTPP